MVIPNDIEQSIARQYGKNIWSKFKKGIEEYEMIQNGDRIAVCISGGKDSMLMAKCMERYQRYSGMDFDLEYIVMDPGYNAENLEKIKENAKRMEIPIKIFEENVFEMAAQSSKNVCFECARIRRRMLYSKAQEIGCNKIALGHHFDDVIETVLMGMLYGSQLQTMMPKIHSENFENMQLIRPLYMVREEHIISWAKANGLEFIRCACRLTDNVKSNGEHEESSKRSEVKALIKSLEKNNPAVGINIFRSMQNVNLQTLLSYHIGEEYHSFLDDYDLGRSIKGTVKDKKINLNENKLH